MSSEKTFDRFVLLLSVMGIGVVIMAIAAMATRPSGVIGAVEADPAGTTVHVTLSEWAISGDLNAPPGPVSFEVHNDGTVTHNFSIVGVGTSDDIPSGGVGVWDAGTLEAGTYEVICQISGHKDAGMRATLTITDGAVAGGAQDHAATEVDWNGLDEAMMNSMLAFPAETEGIGNVPLEPTIVDGVKVFELTVAITPWEVEPGRVVDAWTYNGMVPGPAIRVDLGDRVRVIVHNRLPMGTDVHWHGIHTPNDMDGVAPLTQDLIRSGEDFVYEFTADNPAIGMYHAHHHGQMQIPNGLFGTFIVGELPLPLGQTIGGIPVPDQIDIAREIPMVLNDAGVIGFSLNGKSFPATEPYIVDEGDWLMVHYYNEGLQAHPMHQHQFPQLIIAKDGIPLDHPYWADTINVAPGERYSVILHAVDPGVWVWHCHILNHVEREEGMFGMVTALIVQESA